MKNKILLFLTLIVFALTNLVSAKFEDINSLYYQVSNDGIVWWYTEDNNWYIAQADDDYSSLDEIKENLANFDSDSDEILLKAFIPPVDNDTGQEPDIEVIENIAPEIISVNIVEQSQDGSGFVYFDFVIKDEDKDNTSVTVEYSIDNLNWFPATISLALYEDSDIAVDNSSSEFQIGKDLSIPTSSSEVHVFGAWDSKKDLPDFDGQSYLRFTAYDGLLSPSPTAFPDLVLDNKSPEGIDELLIAELSSSSVRLSWDKLNESDISSFVLFYGNSEFEVTNGLSSQISITNYSSESIEVNGLESNKEYFFQLLIQDENSNKLYSPLINTYTHPSVESSEEEENTETDNQNNNGGGGGHGGSHSENNNNQDSDEINGSEEDEDLVFEDCKYEDFLDVEANFWAKGYIDVLHNTCVNGEPIVKGYSGNIFAPEKPISRYEFLKLLLLANNIDINNISKPERIFSDVEFDDSMISKVIYKAKNLGIIAGYGDGKFYPDREINRAEAAKIILYSSFNLRDEDIEFQEDFPWYTGYISKVMAFKIMSGYSEGKFGPDNNLLRCEAAKIIYNIMVEKGVINN